MTRSITPLFTSKINRNEITDVITIALEIYELNHPSPFYVRVINDNMSATLEGNEYKDVSFQAILLTDSEEEASASISIQNVDTEVGKAIQSMGDRASCRILLVDRSDGVDTIIYDTQTMAVFTDVTGNSLVIEGTIGPALLELEQFPFIRAIKSVAPGLYI